MAAKENNNNLLTIEYIQWENTPQQDVHLQVSQLADPPLHLFEDSGREKCIMHSLIAPFLVGLGYYNMENI